MRERARERESERARERMRKREREMDLYRRFVIANLNVSTDTCIVTN